MNTTHETRTTERSPGRRRGSYGIDAPLAPIFMAAMAVWNLILAILSQRWVNWVAFAVIVSILSLYLHFTLRGKFVLWSRLLDSLKLRGDEQILDLGCGRGAVLLLAAGRLATGRATGVDLWQRLDQSGNSLEATRRNAIAEGVADRVELHTADMRNLPFADNHFDLIVSSLAIHNISGTPGREKAISEAVRVLKPGGRILIADIRATALYAAQLEKLGMSHTVRRRLKMSLWLVTATKPEASAR